MASGRTRGGRQMVTDELDRLQKLVNEGEDVDEVEVGRLKDAQRDYLSKKFPAQRGTTTVKRVNFDKADEDANASPDALEPGLDHGKPSAEAAPIVLSDIVERKRELHARPSRVTNPMTSSNGFPKAAHRSHFRQAVNKAPAPRAQGTAAPASNDEDLASMRKQISAENQEKLKAMSLEEIQEEQANLEAQFSAEILSMLKKRASRSLRTSTQNLVGRGVMRQSQNPAVVPDPEKLRHYFPDVQVEPSKLAWMEDVDAPEAAGTATNDHLRRYTLTGHLLTTKESLDIPTDRGLHHHGDEPGKAGYTIDELFQLSRSSNLSQSQTALLALGNIGESVYKDEADLRTCHEFDEIMPSLLLTLRMQLDVRSFSSLFTSLRVLLQVLGSESSEQLLDFDASILTYDESDTVGRHLEIIRADAIAGLVRTALIPTLCRVLSEHDETNMAGLCLKLLTRCARHSKSICEAIWHNCSLWWDKAVSFIKVNWPAQTETCILTVLVLTLLENLVFASRDIALDLLQLKLDAIALRFLVTDLESDNERDAFVLTLDLFTSLARYRIATLCFQQVFQLLERVPGQNALQDEKVAIARITLMAAVLEADLQDAKHTDQAKINSTTKDLAANALSYSCSYTQSCTNRIVSSSFLSSICRLVRSISLAKRSANEGQIADLVSALDLILRSSPDLTLENTFKCVASIAPQADSTSYCGIQRHTHAERVISRLRHVFGMYTEMISCFTILTDDIASNQVYSATEAFLSGCASLGKRPLHEKAFIYSALPLVALADKCREWLLLQGNKLDKDKSIMLVYGMIGFSSSCSVEGLQWIFANTALSSLLTKRQQQLAEAMYCQRVKAEFTDMGSHIERQITSVPIGETWIMEPLQKLIVRDEIFLQSIHEIPICSFEDVHVAIDESEMTLVVLKMTEALAQRHVLKCATIITTVMKVFMLEQDRAPDLEMEIFRHTLVADAIGTLLAPFEARSSSNNESRQQVELTLSEKAALLQLSLDLLDLYATIGLGNTSFAKLITLPLLWEEPSAIYQSRFWSDHASCLSSIRLDQPDALLLSTGKGLDDHLSSTADGMVALTAMVRALTLPRITKSDHPLLYLIATSHVARALSTQSPLSAKRKHAIKQAVASSSHAQLLQDDLSASNVSYG